MKARYLRRMNLSFSHMVLSQHRLTILFIALFSIILYSNTLQNGFVYDDSTDIINNTLIKSLSNLPELFRKDSTFQAANWTFRPVLTISFFIDYSIFGLKPWGYHLTNLLLHTLNGLLLYIFLTLLLKKTGAGEVNHLSSVIPQPFIISLLFVAHPALTEAVNAIADRGDLLSFLFYMATLILYMRLNSGCHPLGKSKSIYLFSCLTYLLALLSKEMAITLPLIIYCYEWIYRDKRNGIGSILLNRYNLGYIVLSSFYVYLRFFHFHVPGNISYASWSLQERILTMPWLLVNYLKLAFFPVSLSADYSISPVRSIFSVSAVLPFVVIATILTICLLNRWKNKTISFGVLFFFITLIPVYNIVPIPNHFAERYVYLPMVGFAVVLGLLLNMTSRALNTKLVTPNKYIIMPFIGIIFVYSLGTSLRNETWNNEYSFWADTVRKAPNSARAHNGLGLVFSNIGRLYKNETWTNDAIRRFKIALRLNPSYAEAHSNLGITYAEQERTEEAINEFHTAVKLKPDFADAYYNLGNAYLSQGRLDDAAKEYQNSLRLKPESIETHFNIGNVYAAKGMKVEALKEYKEVLKLNPGNTLAIQAIELLSTERDSEKP